MERAGEVEPEKTNTRHDEGAPMDTETEGGGGDGPADDGVRKRKRSRRASHTKRRQAAKLASSEGGVTN